METGSDDLGGLHALLNSVRHLVRYCNAPQKMSKAPDRVLLLIFSTRDDIEVRGLAKLETPQGLSFALRRDQQRLLHRTSTREPFNQSDSWFGSVFSRAES
jgi:hypothetical protein